MTANPDSVPPTKAERDRLLNQYDADAVRDLKAMDHARLAALTEVHEFYEFDAENEEHFDNWLHERIKEVRVRLGLSAPVIEGSEKRDPKTVPETSLNEKSAEKAPVNPAVQ